MDFQLQFVDKYVPIMKQMGREHSRLGGLYRCASGCK